MSYGKSYHAGELRARRMLLAGARHKVRTAEEELHAAIVAGFEALTVDELAQVAGISTLEVRLVLQAAERAAIAADPERPVRRCRYCGDPLVDCGLDAHGERLIVSVDPARPYVCRLSTNDTRRHEIEEG